jgi:outer membrane protein assembly factor BamA
MDSLSAQSSVDTDCAKSNEFDWEVFPFATYDTDAGFGFGIKGYMRNVFEVDESYDLILYNSTKGERWYRVQFSYPDYEVRQGSEYGYALDLIADYDKWISYYFYGIGNSSSYDDRKIYTRVPFEFNLLLNRTITADFILQAGLKYAAIGIIDFPDSLLPADYFYINRADQLLFLINANYDTRNSTINPTSGISLTTGFESSPLFSFTNSSFSRVFVNIQGYNKIIFPELIFADRIYIQQLIGNNIPVQFLLPIGGNKTLRGFPQDRFLDKSSTLINAELRFPIWRRLGGIAGVDAGRVFPSLDKFSFNDWKISPVAGLRFYMDNFVVRADLGISSETIGFYFNFGHIF